MPARGRLTFLFALLALATAGCGGDDDEGGNTTPGNSSASGSSATAQLEFDQVEGFTLDYLQEDAATSKECKELVWVEDEAKQRKLLPLTGTDTVELLTCDGVPYLSYFEYPDDVAASEGLAPALLPYLMDETSVVMPLVAVEEEVASAYLDALKEECACGEVVQPEQ